MSQKETLTLEVPRGEGCDGARKLRRGDVRPKRELHPGLSAVGETVDCDAVGSRLRWQ